MGGRPLNAKELLQLTSQGIDASLIQFANVSLNSAKYVAVRDEAKSQVTVIELANKKVQKLPVKVDGAIMNPVSFVIALRAKDKIQIFDLQMQARLKSASVTGNIVFWKWINTKVVAIVTETEVLHWPIEGDAAPASVFQRAAYEGGPVKIVNYRTTPDQKWLILNGIAKDEASPSKTAGVLQVYSAEAGASQPTLNSHAACFVRVTLDGKSTESDLLCFTRPDNAGGMKLNILEVGVPRTDQKAAFKAQATIPMAANDFALHMMPDNQNGSVFIITRAGSLFIYEVQSAKKIFGAQIAQKTMFAAVEDTDGGGIVSVDQGGRVASISLDREKLVNYCTEVLKDNELGVSMARRYNLGGASGIFESQFQSLMASGQHQQAMELAIKSPQGSLRNMDTIKAFRDANPKLLSEYFQTLLKQGALNSVESVELCRALVKSGGAAKMEHITNWIKEQKLEPSEELGDLLKNFDVPAALSVYLRAKCHDKVISCFLQLGAQESDDEKALKYFGKIEAYAKQAGFNADWQPYLRQLILINQDRAKDFAQMLINDSKLDVNETADLFLQQNDVKNTTNILLDYLQARGDLDEDAALQTKLLEINLMHKPQVADAIMESDDYKFTKYDRIRIAQLCERAQLYQRALEHYSDLSDIKRVLSNTHMLNPEWLLDYFGTFTEPERAIDCLRDLLRYNMQQNIRLVVEVAKKWSTQLGSEELIRLFEEFNSYNGLYFYLQSQVNQTEEKGLVFKYIQAATKLNQLKEVERVCRDNNNFEPKEVKEFLLENELKDPRPLIHVCDRFGYVEELVTYLYQKGKENFIEAYVQRMNAKATPQVVGTLLDLNQSEEKIKKMLQSIRAPPDMPEFTKLLVEEVEKRNRLKILRPWLEARAQEGSTDTEVHNGLGKIYVEINYSANQFLTTNKFYASEVVGAYCETRDPKLAFIAYKRAWGPCDPQLVEVCYKNGFFKDLAKYLVERQDLELWGTVLVEQNEHRRALVDQVVATALPESNIPEEVSTTVKAFMAANLPKELIELLERLILHGPKDGEFQSNRNLQNLLILTAIKADKKRVMDYVTRLENFDGPDIAKIAVSEEYQLYEVAFFIYKKFKAGPDALKVLLNYIKSIDRGVEFAEYWDQPETWSILAEAQLESGLTKECIDSFMKAEDATKFADVIRAAKGDEMYAEVIPFIKMARGKVRDPSLDSDLIYCYAKTKKLSELEEFIGGVHAAKLPDVGESLFEEKEYEAARIIFSSISKFDRLAMCLVKLEQFNEAVEAARKANTMPTWKFVCLSCVDAKEFRLAQICGINVVGHLDQLPEVIRHYELHGYFEELIQLLEQGIMSDRAHQGIYTALGIVYAKYKEEKLMEHVKLFWQRLNIPTLIRECQKNLHWAEAVYLYSQYDQYDNAVNVLITHSARCWKHDLFKDTLKKVNNSQIYYKAIDFYLEEHPLLLTDLLMEVMKNLDHSRVVATVKAKDGIPLIIKYLQHVQRENVAAVNEALNDYYVEEEDYKSLRASVDAFKEFDQISLAQRLERHELLEFRRIAAYVYKMNKRFEASIKLSKKDKLWKDAMETTAAAGSQEQAEELASFFVENELYEAFSASLYACYGLIRPDVVLELAWRHNLMDFAMPFMVQTLREYHNKMNLVFAKFEAVETKAVQKEVEEVKKAEQMAAAASFAQPLAIGAPPGMMGYDTSGTANMGGMNMGYGQPPMGMGMGYQPQNAFFQ
eukprot:g48897.t1